MVSTSKVVRLNSRPEDEPDGSQPHHDFNKIYLCKTCGSAALRHAAKTPTDELLNILIPLRLYECYSCNHRNRFLKDTLRTKFTLIGLSILAAVLVIFVLNKVFEPNTRFTGDDRGVVISPQQDSSGERLSEFDLSYRVPSFFQSEELQLKSSDRAIKKPIAKGEERLTDFTIPPQQPVALATPQIDLAPEADPTAIADIQLTEQERLNQIIRSGNEQQPLVAAGSFYTLAIVNGQNNLNGLANNPSVDQPIFLAYEGGQPSYYYGSFTSAQLATDAISALPSALTVSEPIVTALQSIKARLVLVSD